MSHLQANFIARAKASFKQARTPHAMSRGVLLSAARDARDTPYKPRGEFSTACTTNEPSFLYAMASDYRLDYPDYRVFTLKK